MWLRKQHRRDFLRAVGLPGLLSPQLLGAIGSSRLQSGDRPWNVILVLADDMGWRDLACYGSELYETPEIDRLAAEGIRFTDAYASAPVCSPTRASLLTGKHPARLHLTDWIPGRTPWPTARLLPAQFEQQLPHSEKTLPEALAEGGYTSASIGKWHLGGPDYYPESHGFALNVGGTHRGSIPSFFGPFDLPGIDGGTSDDYITEKLTEHAEKFIEDHQDRPFFLYLSEFAVHAPIQARAAAIEKYRAKLRPGYPQQDPVYAAMVESVDLVVGRLVRKLEQVGIAERTILILTSDNGGLIFEGRSKKQVTSNLPLRAGKGHLYEGGIRVPLIIKWPRLSKVGATCNVPVSSVDLYPTILEMLGLPTRQEPLDGTSLVSLVRGNSGLEREALYWHYPHYSNQGGVPSGAVRKGNLKLIEFYEDGRLELFDLANDPGERRNIAEKIPATARELRQLLEQWRRTAGATMPHSNAAYDPTKSDQGLTGAELATEPER